MPDTNTSNALFYNAVNSDRLYDADSFAHLVNAFFNSGISAWGGGLSVTAEGGMTVKVASGLANCAGKIGVFPEPTIVTIDTASSSGNRIDVIVVRRDDSNRQITIAVKKGEVGGTAPGLSTSGLFELELAKVAVRQGAVEITTANIDLTGRKEITQTVDGSAIAGFQSQFETWFQSAQDALSETPTGSLINRMSEAEEDITEIQGAIGNSGLAGRVTTLEGLMDEVSTLKITKIWSAAAYTGDSILRPTQLISATDIAEKVGQTTEHDMMLVYVKRDYNEGSPLIPIFLRKDETVRALDLCDDGKFRSRMFRWNTATFTLNYKKDTHWTGGEQIPKEEYDPGLMCGWGCEGFKEKTSGYLFEGWTTSNSSYTTAAAAQKANNSASGANVKYNIWMLPVAAYLISGAKGGNA